MDALLSIFPTTFQHTRQGESMFRTANGQEINQTSASFINNSGINTCFVDVSGVKSLYYGQYRDYAASWEIFRRVELYNSNVSTQRGQGNSNLTYYQFYDNQEHSLYRQGANLFATYIGYTSTVQKN
jgi:hypothetical protein